MAGLHPETLQKYFPNGEAGKVLGKVRLSEETNALAYKLYTALHPDGAPTTDEEAKAIFEQAEHLSIGKILNERRRSVRRRSTG